MTEGTNNPTAPTTVEPEKNHRGRVVGSPHGTTPDGDPDRSNAIWKSVLTATGGFGCERETYYREVVRDERGYRLRMGMGEPVIFGIGVDRAHRSLMEQRWIGEEPSVEQAVQAGMEVARGRLTDHPWTDEEWQLLYDRVHLAAEKLTGEWPNRVTEKGVAKPEPDGTPSGPPIRWLDPPHGVQIEAQVKLFAPDVVGGRGITGQPDYTYRAEGIFVGWADIKALSKSGSYPAKWTMGEAVAYDYLLTQANGGVLPEWHVYLEYRRVAKPYWALAIAPVADTVVTLARAYFARWQRALDGHDPDALSFRPAACHSCDYRLPIPEFGHDGCPIGASVLAIAPAPDEDG